MTRRQKNRVGAHPILDTDASNKQRLKGTSIKDQIGENKFPLFVEFDKAAKAKPADTWVDYMWAKLGAEKQDILA